MTRLPFRPSAPLTLGVELELQIVRAPGFDLMPAAGALLDAIGDGFPGDAKPEITESMIEIATAVHRTHAGVLAQLTAMRDALAAAAGVVGVRLAGGGTHPFQFWPDRRITAGARHEALFSRYGYLAKQFTVFGQHIHVGVASGDDALYLVHRLARYVPHFIALSASSPYSQGVDSMFDASRPAAIAAFPLAGRAPVILDWRSFVEGYYTKMHATGAISSMKDFYWDIRPKPEYGTVELRVCDTPLTVARAAALAGYMQTLCAWLLATRDETPQESDYDLYACNRFQAARFGLDGEIHCPRTGRRVPLREDIGRLLDWLEPEATALACQDAFNELRGVLDDGNDARWLRQRAEAHGALPAVVADAAHRFLQ